MPAEPTRAAQSGVITRRFGNWTYGAHLDLNPGWRLDGTNLVLDFDPRGRNDGCYVLWTGGQPGEDIDRYLAGAMKWVERDLTERVLIALGGQP